VSSLLALLVRAGASCGGEAEQSDLSALMGGVGHREDPKPRLSEVQMERAKKLF